MWIHDMFGADKPIIALLHLDALPGDPGFCGDMDVVLDHAARDLTALQDGGVDGILIANEFSLPYQPGHGIHNREAEGQNQGSLWGQRCKESHCDY